MLAGSIVKLAWNCLTEFLRGDVGLGDLTMVEWHTSHSHFLNIGERLLQIWYRKREAVLFKAVLTLEYPMIQ